MDNLANKYAINMTNAGIHDLHNVNVIDELGKPRNIAITGERPLTVYLDKQEIVTLMTLGAHPELLTIGYLRNQQLIDRPEDILSVQVDWDIDAVAVTTCNPDRDFSNLTAKRTVTSGCGQGTMFSHVIDSLDNLHVSCPPFSANTIYNILDQLSDYNKVYKQAGAVHGCALCTEKHIHLFIEDVGRHNAVDAIAGWMWINNISGQDKTFYTTGRLTSEMVIKVAQMQIPLLLSRSGVTEMGLNLAKQTGIGMVARAKGRHFLIFNAKEQFTHE